MELTAGMVLHACDLLLHTSHWWDRADARSARLLHNHLMVIFRNMGEYSLSPSDVNELGWAYERLLSQPPIIWTVDDVLSVSPTPPRRDVFYLPTNVDLDSSAKVVLRAQERFGTLPFEELKSKAPGEMGQIIETSAGSHDLTSRIRHVVCRYPNNPKLVALKLSSLPEIQPVWPATQHLIPVWGTDEDVDLWETCLVEAQHSTSIQAPPPRIVLGFLPQDLPKALKLEKQLIRRGLVVGRNSAPEYPASDIAEDVWPTLARRVRPEGPLTPDRYADWKYSGIVMPPAAWDYHYQVLTGSIS